MPTFTYTVQTSHDQGITWIPGRTDTIVPEQAREDAEELGDAKPYTEESSAQRLAADILDAEYRKRLEGNGAEPVPVLQVLVWDGPVAQGTPTATSSTGTDSQWQATGDLIEEIANDIRHFEAEKKQHLAAAANTQTAITNAKDRLARVVASAARMQMPQVTIAHRAGRSREWVRQITG
ncbi:hypothetical protein EDD98_5607 [Streptomyces sp. PanSC19]|uniref:hypothetical protein n=1 Tax=Streptomyces sp. PanSC19 TaxID=1520455 RepID=UPI000F461769|nr:hypothetical protein [Streptomyces sp. PanSC19]ROQ26024.1 hypothetical protein EDD98_5607 [Streptomyces sp. PanSC19]